MQSCGTTIMSISPQQCRAARALFAMNRQELANASGVSLRTITSFEDSSDRLPIAGNLAAIREALERLGVRFIEGGVGWFSPFSQPQMRVIRALAGRNRPPICSLAELYGESGCSRGDLEALARLQVIEGIDTIPLLTAIGLHMPRLLQDHENREAARDRMYAPVNYDVHPDDSIIFHARTATSFRIKDDGTLAVHFDAFLPEDEMEKALAGAREALRQHRERDPRVVGKFVWRG
jgi:hypothetical protein